MKRNRCECGCGKLVRSGKRFISGHNRTYPWLGKKRSLKTRRRMSKAQEGHAVSEETKKKLSKASRGHITSEETKKKLSDTRKKKKSNWDKYHPYMPAFQYRRLQNEVRHRDHHKCIQCGNKKNRLDVHHVVPIRIGYKSRLCDHYSNLVTLCISCHSKAEPGTCQDKWKEFLPFAKKYLSRFGYKEMLLDSYINSEVCINEHS